MSVSILLDGTAYTLRPTFDALSRVEKELGASLTELADALANGAMTLEALALIITECAEPNLSANFVRGALLQSGFLQAMQAVAMMFSTVFGGWEARCDEVITRGELAAMLARFPDGNY